MDLVDACERYVGQASLNAKRAQMEKRAMTEVVRFKQCKVDGNTGKEIFEELLKQKKLGKGAEELCTAASPKKVATWMRQSGCYPVIWHMVKEEYQFASELHAKAAAQIFKGP